MVVELFNLGGRHVVVVLGKGGVGKTTVSILIASELARVGETLLVSFDPAKHFTKYLGVKEPGREYRIGENLYAIQLDIEKAARKIIEEHIVVVKAILPTLSALNLEDVVDVIYHSPGFEEEVFLRWLEQLYTVKYRHVVVDTPPTGIALRTLTLPRLYRLWLEKLVDIREKIVARRYVIAKALGREIKLEDPVLNKLRELLERFKRLREDLASSEKTSYVIVTNPEPLPMYEAEMVAQYLKKEFLREPTLIVMNKSPEDSGVDEVFEHFRKLPGAKLLIKRVSPPPSSFEEVLRLKESIEGI
ncbi:MAG: ArsA-related P-loop ATPase [Pyrobaculum sp.]